MKKSITLQWKFNKDKDADLLAEYSPISLLMAGSIIEESGNIIEIQKSDSNNDMKEIGDMILNSKDNSIWKVTFEICN